HAGAGGARLQQQPRGTDGRRRAQRAAGAGRRAARDAAVGDPSAQHAPARRGRRRGAARDARLLPPAAQRRRPRRLRRGQGPRESGPAAGSGAALADPCGRRLGLERGGGSMMATVRDYASLVKLSHSVFALPFALIALLVATGGWPKPPTLAWAVVAMVCARAAAMAYTRFADRDVDARNPRTAGRELPRGVIRPGQALALTVVAGLAFVAAATALGPVCGLLSLPVLAVLLGYSHAKRFTACSHV